MARAEQRSFWAELASLELYKRNQGRLARTLTALGIAVIIAAGAYEASQSVLMDFGRNYQIGVPLVLCAVGFWAAFRAVNFPPFAEFLISVETEMHKVSWASWDELYRAAIVVIGSMVILTVVLFIYDTLWIQLLTFIGVLQVSA